MLHIYCELNARNKTIFDLEEQVHSFSADAIYYSKYVWSMYEV